MSLLQVNHVSKVFKVGGLLTGASLTAVDQLSLAMAGDTATILSVVGESGSGKTTLARMILRLLEPTTGTIRVEPRASTTGLRGSGDALAFRRLVQPIFQNPFEAFSLRRKVEAYLFDTAIRLRVASDRQSARQAVADALASVGLDLKYVSGKYPSHFSGGELQRIAIARALICRPKLIVADEPVAMIDASLKMTIVNLFLKLKEEFNISFVYVTHDLSTAYYVSDFIAVMYRGSLVEYGPAATVLTTPTHPYTELLMNSLPMVGVKWDDSPETARGLTDDVVSSVGCKFTGRCAYVQEICRTTHPPMVTDADGRQALCFRPVNYRAEGRLTPLPDAAMQPDNPAPPSN